MFWTRMQPELAARWCLEYAGLEVTDLDAVTYSYDPDRARPAEEMGLSSQELVDDRHHVF